MLRLTLFGGFSLAGSDGVELPIKSQKAKALIAYLALSPGLERSREEIMALVWSDRAEAQARASLRQVLFGLRQVLGEDGQEALRVSDHSVALDASQIAVDEADTGGELLGGFHLNDPAFEEWLRDERLRLENGSPEEPKSATGTDADKPSIAVLPFANMSGDPKQEYFSDGITEDIITELSRFDSLYVIAPNSSFAFKGESIPMGEIGERLGVQFCVQGSVRKLGLRIRVAAQLIEIETGKHLWADRYDREIEDIFAIQDEVASRVAAMVPGHVDNAKRVLSERKPANDVTAYETLLRAEWLFNNDFSSKEGLRLLYKAIEIDPEYAATHARLAVHHAYSIFVCGVPIEEAERLTRFHGDAAAKFAPTDASVHAPLGEAFLMIGDHELAAHHSDTALALNPNGYYVRIFVSLVRAYLGKIESAIELIEQVRDNDPYGGPSWRETIFEVYYLAGRYEDAVASILGWRDPPAHMVLAKAAALAHLDRAEETEAEFRNFMSVWPDAWGLDELAQSYRRMCARPQDADNWLDGFRKAGLKI